MTTATLRRKMTQKQRLELAIEALESIAKCPSMRECFGSFRRYHIARIALKEIKDDR